MSPFPTFFATLLALGLGLLIPLFSSIVPIQKALSKNCNVFCYLSVSMFELSLCYFTVLNFSFFFPSFFLFLYFKK